MFGVIHMDASGEEDPPFVSLSYLYDELRLSGIVDGNVAVVHDDTGWCMSAHRDGRLVFEHLGEKGTERHMTEVPKDRAIKLWTLLIQGEFDLLSTEPWIQGYIGKVVGS